MSISFRLLWLACLLSGLTVATRIQDSADKESNPKVRKAQAALDAAVRKAIQDYVAKLEEAAKEAAAQGNRQEATVIDAKRKAMETYGLSTIPDPTARAKRILVASTFKKTDGAVLEFRSDYTAYGRHNRKTTNWVMTDARTLITGATDPTKPLYIHKFTDNTLSRGVVYKYQPVINEKRQTVRRTGR